MLQSKLLHPEILRVLAQSGHGSKVLIADGNYPFNTASHPNATRVYLNLRPGMVNVVDILDTLISAIPVEAAEVMQPTDGSEPPVFEEFRRLLPTVGLQKLERFAFYAAAREPDVALVVASGERRVWANILLTIGVIPPTGQSRIPDATSSTEGSDV